MAKIIITIEIGEPKKKGPRDIIVSGAPAGEMPVIKTGLFADRHVLADAIYAELQRREPQVPKHVEPKPEKQKSKETPEEESRETETEIEGDQLVAPDDLPVINEPAGEPQLAQAIHSPLEAAILAVTSE